jgi:hypothetical protein
MNPEHESARKKRWRIASGLRVWCSKARSGTADHQPKFDDACMHRHRPLSLHSLDVTELDSFVFASSLG